MTTTTQADPPSAREPYFHIKLENTVVHSCTVDDDDPLDSPSFNFRKFPRRGGRLTVALAGDDCDDLRQAVQQLADGPDAIESLTIEIGDETGHVVRVASSKISNVTFKRGMMSVDAAQVRLRTE